MRSRIIFDFPRKYLRYLICVYVQFCECILKKFRGKRWMNNKHSLYLVEAFEKCQYCYFNTIAPKNMGKNVYMPFLIRYKTVSDPYNSLYWFKTNCLGFDLWRYWYDFLRLQWEQRLFFLIVSLLLRPKLCFTLGWYIIISRNHTLDIVISEILER